MGNLRSVEKALEHVGATRDDQPTTPTTVRAADGVILPGVGAFPRAMERIRELRPRRADRRAPRRRRADPRHLPRPAAALRLDHRARRRRRPRPARRARSTGSSADGLKVPHIGWSPVRWERESRLTEGIESETPFYFVHSFAPRPDGRATCSAAPTTAPASPARPSATTSSASSSTPRSRAPPACGCSPTSPGSAPRPPGRGVILYPAIDIRGGQAVRLLQGDYERETAYDADPVDAAPRWAGRRRRVPPRRRPRRGEGGRAAEPRRGAADRRRGRVPDPGRRRAARRRTRSRPCSRPAPSGS